MRFVDLRRKEGDTYIDAAVNYGCGPNFVRNRWKLFRQMIKEQGVKFWFRFWLTFCLQPDMKKLDEFSKHLPIVTPLLSQFIHSRFVQVSAREAVNYCWNTVFDDDPNPVRIIELVLSDTQFIDETYHYVQTNFACALGEVFYKWLLADDNYKTDQTYWEIPPQYLHADFQPGQLERFMSKQWGRNLPSMLGVTMDQVPWIRKCLRPRGSKYYNAVEQVLTYHTPTSECLKTKQVSRHLKCWDLKVKKIKKIITDMDEQVPTTPKRSSRDSRVCYGSETFLNTHKDAPKPKEGLKPSRIPRYQDMSTNTSVNTDSKTYRLISPSRKRLPGLKSSSNDRYVARETTGNDGNCRQNQASSSIEKANRSCGFFNSQKKHLQRASSDSTIYKLLATDSASDSLVTWASNDDSLKGRRFSDYGVSRIPVRRPSEDYFNILRLTSKSNFKAGKFTSTDEENNYNVQMPTTTDEERVYSGNKRTTTSDDESSEKEYIIPMGSPHGYVFSRDQTCPTKCTDFVDTQHKLIGTADAVTRYCRLASPEPSSQFFPSSCLSYTEIHGVSSRMDNCKLIGTSDTTIEHCKLVGTSDTTLENCTLVGTSDAPVARMLVCTIDSVQDNCKLVGTADQPVGRKFICSADQSVACQFICAPDQSVANRLICTIDTTPENCKSVGTSDTPENYKLVGTSDTASQNCKLIGTSDPPSAHKLVGTSDILSVNKLVGTTDPPTARKLIGTSTALLTRTIDVLPVKTSYRTTSTSPVNRSYRTTSTSPVNKSIGTTATTLAYRTTSTSPVNRRPSTSPVNRRTSTSPVTRTTGTSPIYKSLRSTCTSPVNKSILIIDSALVNKSIRTTDRGTTTANRSVRTTDKWTITANQPNHCYRTIGTNSKSTTDVPVPLATNTGGVIYYSSRPSRSEAFTNTDSRIDYTSTDKVDSSISTNCIGVKRKGNILRTESTLHSLGTCTRGSMLKPVWIESNDERLARTTSKEMAIFSHARRMDKTTDTSLLNCSDDCTNTETPNTNHTWTDTRYDGFIADNSTNTTLTISVQKSVDCLFKTFNRDNSSNTVQFKTIQKWTDTLLDKPVKDSSTSTEIQYAQKGTDNDFVYANKGVNNADTDSSASQNDGLNNMPNLCYCSDENTSQMIGPAGKTNLRPARSSKVNLAIPTDTKVNSARKTTATNSGQKASLSRDQSVKTKGEILSREKASGSNKTGTGTAFHPISKQKNKCNYTDSNGCYSGNTLVVEKRTPALRKAEDVENLDYFIDDGDGFPTPDIIEFSWPNSDSMLKPPTLAVGESKSGNPSSSNKQSDRKGSKLRAAKCLNLFTKRSSQKIDVNARGSEKLAVSSSDGRCRNACLAFKPVPGGKDQFGMNDPRKILRQCSGCYNTIGKMKKCQQCVDENWPNPRYYCGIVCQTKHWFTRHEREHYCTSL